jgi:hypothetical protein
MPPDTVIYKGRSYRRYPQSKRRDARVYYRASFDGKTHFLHRDIYIDVFGDIPSAIHVHHKDHDTFNNNPSNLQAIDGVKHSRDHFLNDAKAWHRTSAGRRWHASHAASRQLISKERICDECQKQFHAPQSNRQFCSKRCSSKSWRRRNPEQANAILQRHYAKKAAHVA